MKQTPGFYKADDPGPYPGPEDATFDDFFIGGTFPPGDVPRLWTLNLPLS